MGSLGEERRYERMITLLQGSLHFAQAEIEKIRLSKKDSIQLAEQ